MPESSLETVLPLRKLLAVLAVAMAAGAHAHAAADKYRVIDRQIIEGPVRWDYLSIDAARNHLFLTRGDHVDVYDMLSKQITGSILNTPGVHGVAYAPDQDFGYTSNGGNDTVSVFKLSSLKDVKTLAVGAKPDAIIYDARSGRIFVANAKGESLSVIDARSNELAATIALGGAPETAVVDGKGHLYIAIEDKNVVAVIDTASMKVLRQDRVAPACDEPAGLAIDVSAGHLFVGCHNKKMIVLDAVTGKILATPAIGAGNDAIAFDPERQLAFASNGDGTLTVVDGKAPFTVQQIVPTMPRARTMALDPVSHALYLVAAETLAENAPGPANPKARPSLKPGTFTLLKVAAP